MTVERGQLVRVKAIDGNTYTGTIYQIVIEQCEDDDNKPHAMIFISQDRRFINSEGEFGHVSLWLEAIESIRKLEGTGCNNITTSLRVIHDEAENLLKDAELRNLLESKSNMETIHCKCGKVINVNFNGSVLI